MLNALWLSFFITAAISAISQCFLFGNYKVFSVIVESIFSMAKLSVELMILMFGTLTVWLGFLRIAEKSGIVSSLGKALAPIFKYLMPEVPPNHPALGLITLNCVANGLGLDNAATPIGLRAMRALQDLNPSSRVASNAQILFLVLNASSLTLLPVNIFMYRAQQGSSDPTLVFLPILISTIASTTGGLFSVAFIQKLPLLKPKALTYVAGLSLLITSFLYFLGTLSVAILNELSSLLGNLTLFTMIVLFLVVGSIRKVKAYECFIEGAREGFDISKNLLPYLTAMLCAVGVLRGSGALEILLNIVKSAVELFNGDTRFVDALPSALMRPFSGSASRALLVETMKNNGVDSFPSLVAATVQGSTETTFYVLAVYFSAVRIQNARHAVGCALVADACGIITSVIVCYWFFG